jgi:hypothetical protein
MQPLDDGGDDHEQWYEWTRPYLGKSWYDARWLLAESYFYRKILAAVCYFDPGPWRYVDPFAPTKRADLYGSAVDGQLAALDALGNQSTDRVDAVLLEASLWGNRADLGFRLTQPESDTTGELVVDDRERLWELLDTPSASSGLAGASAGPAGANAGQSPHESTVHVIADNAAAELLPDLVLIDHLLTTGRASRVVLHVKPYPYYVSDATSADVIDCLRRLVDATGYARESGCRLWEAMRSARLVVATHPYWCSPLSFHDMPDELRATLATATLTIVKGDLNYRRLLGDRLWSPTRPFDELVAYFPSPVAALRTLKSDVIAGLAPDTVAALDSTGQPWRTSGSHALVQVSVPAGAAHQGQEG